MATQIKRNHDCTPAEWQARLSMRGIFDAIRESLRTGDLKRLAKNTTANWEGPLKTIIPWVTNRFTETIIERGRRALGQDFWGFLMLGGMSGGGGASGGSMSDTFRCSSSLAGAASNAELWAWMSW